MFLLVKLNGWKGFVFFCLWSRNTALNRAKRFVVKSLNSQYFLFRDEPWGLWGAVIVFTYLHTFKRSVLFKWTRPPAFISLQTTRPDSDFVPSPLSRVKQRFVRPNETPVVSITFPVCRPPRWSLLWLYADNGRPLCLIRVPGSGRTRLSFAHFPLSLCNPCPPTTLVFLRPAEEEVMGTLTRLGSSHPITAKTKTALFPGPRFEAPQRER